ncbi:MAG: HemK/PrmC family methyltransferase [Gemmatimonadota bacterium]
MTEVTISWAALQSDGIRRLTEAGVEQPGREARWIWESVTGVGLRDRERGSQLPLRDRSRWEESIGRRCAGEPLAYVLGEAAFRHLTLKSDSRALIPRPETEGLVDLVLAHCSAGRVLDVGTGTGCLALSLAREGHYDVVVAVDKSADAIALARENIQSAGPQVGPMSKGRLPVLLLRGDLSSMAGSDTFDVLVSNPPYLSDLEYEALDHSVRDWEPGAALTSGPVGLEITEALLGDGLRVVRPGGWIALELDCSRADQASRYAQQAGWTDISLRDDLFGRARYLLARRSD